MPINRPTAYENKSLYKRKLEIHSGSSQAGCYNWIVYTILKWMKNAITVLSSVVKTTYGGNR